MTTLLSRTWQNVCLLSALLLLGTLFPGTSQANPLSASELWEALRAGGKVIMIRHSRTISGFGDPPGYDLEHCETQRYLSEDGKAQSRRMGVRFREEGVPIESVLSSQWCRCYETAELAFGTYELWPALNSFFDDYSTRDSQTREILQRASRFQGAGNLILVTHQVNITAATGRSVSSGEAVILQPEGGSRMKELGRIRFD